MSKKPLTNAQIVANSRQRAIDAGARKVGPLLLRDAEAIATLDVLQAKHGSIRAALEHALHAAKKELDIS